MSIFRIFIFRWKLVDGVECGLDSSNQKIIVKTNSKYYRPTEVDLLLGDPEKAKKKLKWHPKYTFAQLVREMVFADIDSIRKNKSQF